MENQENKVYNWLIKRGNILLSREGHQIQLEFKKENGESCLLTEDDTEDIISIMTSLAQAIWAAPDYIKEPYTGQLYKTRNDDGFVYWDIGQSRLNVGFNVSEGVVEMDHAGDAALKVPVNYAVEIIQVMTHFLKHFNA